MLSSSVGVGRRQGEKAPARPESYVAFTGAAQQEWKGGSGLWAVLVPLRMCSFSRQQQLPLAPLGKRGLIEKMEPTRPMRCGRRPEGMADVRIMLDGH
jgi:hypothetical protein